jgi:hypothetical protein
MIDSIPSPRRREEIAITLVRTVSTFDPRDQASMNTHVRNRAPAGAVSVMSVVSLAYDEVLVLHFGRAQNPAAIVKDIVAPLFLNSPMPCLWGE